MGSGRYFGFVIGGATARGARRRLARLGVGPEHGPRRADAGDVGARGGRGPLGARAARPPGQRVVRLRHGLPDGPRHLLSPRRGSACYARAGWDVREHGLAGAPPLRVVVGGSAARHASTARCGCSASAARRRSSSRPTARAGCDVSELPRRARRHDGPTIVCAQAGEVNTGAFDDLDAIADACRRRGRVGARRRRVRALGGREPAAPAPRRRVPSAPTRGRPTRTSGSTSPTTAASRSARTRDAHAAAMEYAAPYLAVSDQAVARDPMGYSPEFSRRARSAPVWAAIRELGREGVAELVERCCAPRAGDRAADRARSPAARSLNDVVLNQVLFRFEDDERTRAVPRGGAGRGRGMDEPDDVGRAARRSGSRSSGWRTTRRRRRAHASPRSRAPRDAAATPTLQGYSSAGASAARSAISRDDRRVGERRRVAERPVLGDVAQQPAHDLPRARLRQLGREDDVRRLRDRADLRRDVVAQLLEHLDRALVAALERHVGDDRLARWSRPSGRRPPPRRPSGGRRAPTRPRSSRCGAPRRSSRRRRGRAARSRRRRRCARRRPRSRGRGSAPSTSSGTARRRRRSRASSPATAARARGSRRPARPSRPARSRPTRRPPGTASSPSPASSS